VNDAGAGDLALEQGIGGYRRAMHDGADVGKVGQLAADASDEAIGLVACSPVARSLVFGGLPGMPATPSGRGHFVDEGLASLLVEKKHIGEGAADIDPDDIARTLLSCRRFDCGSLHTGFLLLARRRGAAVT
jgi:hypothetical protein